MRVCLATTSFPRWENDHRVPFMLELARELKRQGHFVRVVGLTCPQELVQFLSGSRDDRSRQRGCQLGHQDRFGCGWAIA